MRPSNHTAVWNAKHILFLFALTIICFWPLAFGIFSAKNDNILQFLPTRFHVSEALRSGHLPLWTPYMYLGYPLHGDMQGGAWNPFVWFISIFGRYNLVSLHCEILFYIFISGLGMYRLLAALGVSPMLRLTGAAAYLMCGYITDVAGSNLPFLAAAAYVPFIFAFYYHLLATNAWPYALKTSVFLALLFVSGYPSFFICTCYILLAALLCIVVRDWRNRESRLMSMVGTQLLVVVTFLALSAPAIISYLQILPFYQRGSGVSLSAALENSFHPYCGLSILLPSVPIKLQSTLATDLISKNVYFNSFLFIFLLCYARTKKNLLGNFVLVGIVFFFLFSLGEYTPVRKWCYQLLPLMNTFRHPSNARLFVIIGCIALAIAVYQNYASGLVTFKIPRTFTAVIACILLIVMAFSAPHVALQQKLSSLSNHTVDTRVALKSFFDSLSSHELAVLNGITQLIVFVIFYFATRKKNHPRLTWLFIINSLIFAQMTIPYTLVSKTKPKVINLLIKEFPVGFPIPDPTTTIATNSKDALTHVNEIGIETFYNKKIATVDLVFTPTFMTQMDQIMRDGLYRSNIMSRPYAYFDKQDIQTSFVQTKFWNNGFEFQTNTGVPGVFHLRQLFLPGWSGAIDNSRTNLIKVDGAFLGINVPPGQHKITFVYRPQGIILCFIISFFSLIAVTILLSKTIPGATKIP